MLAAQFGGAGFWETSLRILALVAGLAVLAGSGCERADDRAAAARKPGFNLGYCGSDLASTTEIPVGICIASPNKAWVMIMDPKGALDIAPVAAGAPGRTVWATGSSASEQDFAKAIFQSDGNLVIYDRGKPIWDTQTPGAIGIYRLQLTDQGELLISSPDGAPVWSSKSGKARRG
jgi:hypothetical protein